MGSRHDNTIDENSGRYDVLGIKLAEFDEGIDLDNGERCRHGGNRIEIPRRLPVGQVAPAIGLCRFHQRDVALQRLLEDMQPPVDLAVLLALAEFGAALTGEKKPPNPAAAQRMRSLIVPCGTSSSSRLLAR